MSNKYYAIQYYKQSEGKPACLVILPYSDKDKAREQIEDSLADLKAVTSFGGNQKS